MKYQVCRELTPIEYEALKADIAANGVLIPIDVDEEGEILDGHHRMQAYQELVTAGVDIPKPAQIVRQGYTEEQKRNHARKLNLLRRQLSEEEQIAMRRDMRADGATYQEIADDTGISLNTAYRQTQDVELFENEKLPGKDGKYRPPSYKPKAEPPPSLFVPGDNEKETEDAIRKDKAKKRRDDRVSEIVTPDLESLGIRYPIIYADPPWQYEHSKTHSRDIENQYPTMALEQICELPVSDIATADSALFLWATSPKLCEAMRVISAWGFEYRTCMVWDKKRAGMGYYARQQHELMLIASRGALPVPEPENRPPSVIHIKRDNQHSRKPERFYSIIEAMYPEYAKIELFARKPVDGWDSWGNQLDST